MRRPRIAVAAALLLTLANVQAPATAQPDATPIQRAIRSGDAKSKDVRAFYAARHFRPLWIEDGIVTPAAETLLALIEDADLDGLDPDDYRPRALASALERASSGSAKDEARAELMLSRSFALLARDMRRPRDVGMVYADAQLAPRAPGLLEVLEGAGRAPSLQTHLSTIGWMHPLYGRLRSAARREVADADPSRRRAIRASLDRLRALPADPGKRYVLVDAAAARLWMYENGKVAGTMRVVVGKPTEPTPMMAALIRYASLNPYWNIPPDLVRIRVAPGALEKGPSFLKAKRFEALSDWSDDARVVDPATIDWRAVQAGTAEARVRQLPGPNNAMGRVKFMFPNALGIYLHDTPEKALLKESDRLFSSGCVRLEDAPRLGRWLFGKPLPTKAAKPEKRVDLPKPVPVYITYLTAAPDGDTLAFRTDVYGRDGVRERRGGDEWASRER